MNYPRISIVTPSYNQAEYIEQTINSIILQKYHDLEYIIMDGGSTDGTVEIIKKYERYLKHWESQKDDGQADAIFRGFECATGEILGWVNSDDLLLPGALEKVGRFFALHQQEKWVTGGTIIIDTQGNFAHNRLGNPCCNLGAPVTFKHLLFLGCPFNQPASFWRKDTFFEVNGFDRSLRFCFDYDLFFRLSRKRPSANIKSLLACFRVHEKSKSSTISNIRDEENELLWERYGLYKKSKTYRFFAKRYYLLFNYLRAMLVQSKLTLGLLKIPRQY